MDRDQAAVGPIADVERLLIVGRKFRAGSEDHSGRRTHADIHHRWQAVSVILGPLGAAFTIAVVTTTHCMERANRPIPWIAPVPFHITVKAEKLAIRVEGDVIVVALP